MNTPSFIGFILGITGIVILLFLGRKTKDPYWKCVWRSSLLFCSMYILILIVMAVNAQYLSFQLEAMDVNGNGQIDLNEYTEEYRVVRDRLLKDPERNNAFYTGAILSFVMALIALSIDLFTTYFQSRTNSIKI